MVFLGFTQSVARFCVPFGERCSRTKLCKRSFISRSAIIPRFAIKPNLIARSAIRTVKESGDSGRPFPVEAKEDSSVEKLKPGVPEFPIPTSLDPSDEKDYKACVEYWRRHFTFCEDVYELDRGLNVVFTTDWVPDIQVIEDALRAARRLNQFPVAVRIIEALEKHAYNVAMYREYIEKLKPLLEELGVPEKRDLGDFKMTFKRIWWRQ